MSRPSTKSRSRSMAARGDAYELVLHYSRTRMNGIPITGSRPDVQYANGLSVTRTGPSDLVHV